MQGCAIFLEARDVAESWAGWNTTLVQEQRHPKDSNPLGLHINVAVPKKRKELTVRPDGSRILFPFNVVGMNGFLDIVRNYRARSCVASNVHQNIGP